MLAAEGGRRAGGGAVEAQGQGGGGDFAGAETPMLGRQAGEGSGLGAAWGPSSLVRNSAQAVAQGGNTGSSGDGAFQHSPLLDALADGRVFEALPSALKMQIEGRGDTVSGASTTHLPVSGGPVVAATPSGPGVGPVPFGKGSAEVRTDSPVLSEGSVSPMGFMGFAGGPPPGPGGAGTPPPEGPVSLGDSGTPKSEDVSSPAVVAGGTGGSGGIVLQSTEAGYKAEDGVVVLMLCTVGGGIHAQVSFRDGTLLSERPISNRDSFRTLGQQATRELTGSPPVQGE